MEEARGSVAVGSSSTPARSAAPARAGSSGSTAMVVYGGSTASTADRGPIPDDMLSKLRAKAELLRERMKQQDSPPDPAVKHLTTDLALQMEAAPLTPVQVDTGMPQNIGMVFGVLDGVTAQEVAKKVIDRAKDYCLVMACTFDRQDIVDALKRAKARHVDVIFVIDRGYTLSCKTKECMPRLQELEAHGIKVRLASGHSAKEEYRAVGRSFSGRGIVHGKVVHTENESVIGSCNWTTSSRTNEEVSLHVKLSGVESAKLSGRIRCVADRGQPVGEAATVAEQRQSVTRSQSPTRTTRSVSRSSSWLGLRFT